MMYASSILLSEADHWGKTLDFPGKPQPMTRAAYKNEKNDTNPLDFIRAMLYSINAPAKAGKSDDAGDCWKTQVTSAE